MLFRLILSAVLILGVATSQAQAAGSQCQRRKLRAVNKLARCHLAAWARADRVGASPMADLEECQEQFLERWALLDLGTDCLTQGDSASVHDDIAACVDDVAGGLITPPKVIFTTEGLFHGGPGPVASNFQYVSGADRVCQEAADAVPALQGKAWRAWISGADPDVAGGAVLSAGERTTHSPGPYVRTDGVLIAVNYSALTSGSLLAPLEVDQRGYLLGDPWGVWTGTGADGGALPGAERCKNGDFDWNNNGIGVTGRLGNPHSVDANWTDWFTEDCGDSFHLYCIEQ